MTNIQASLLLHQLDRIEKYRERKEQISKLYDRGFSKNIHIKMPAITPGIKHARHIYTIWVDSRKRDYVMHKLQDKGIGIAVNFRPIHLMSYYKNKYNFKSGDYPNAETIGASTITIPLYPKLTVEEINYIIKSVNEITSA